MKKYVDKILKLRKSVSIKHHIPGRLRLKYKFSIITQIGFFNADKIDELIHDFPAIKKHNINKTTQSLLIEYDSSVIPPHLIDALFAESARSG